MGVFMARVFNREKTFMDPVLRPIERLLYRVTGVDEEHEMRWTEYAIAMLLFSVVSMIVLYLIQRLQGFLPFNPQKFGAVNPPHVAFNTAASFTTNTNWQAYAGESTMSYFTQMAGLAYHNFVSAAVGHRAGHCLHPRHRTPSDGDHRQLLGRFGSRVPCGSCCRSALWARCCWFRRAWCRIFEPYDNGNSGRATASSDNGRRWQNR